MRRIGWMLLCGLMLSGCATMGYRTTGVEGSVAWRIKNLHVDREQRRQLSSRRGLLSSRRGLLNGQEHERSTYFFTLVLRERQGLGRRYNRLTYTVMQPNASPSDQIDNKTGWILPPHGETEIPGLNIRHSRRCPDAGCHVNRLSLYWVLNLTGVDDNGQAVRTTLDMTFPVDLSAPPSLGTTHLPKADLAGALLTEVNLPKANLQDAILSRATLRRANLAGANLSRAVLDNADLHQTNLAGADLRQTQGLTQPQLDVACVDEKTQLPGTLKRPPPCS